MASVLPSDEVPIDKIHIGGVDEENDEDADLMRS